MQIQPAQDVPEPPTDYVLVAEARDLQPVGATLNPPATIEMSYDSLPEDVEEEDLVIAYYNADSGEWETLASDPHPNKDKTVLAKVSTFGTFAILASTAVAGLNSWVVIGPIVWLALIGLITLALLRFY